MGFSVEFCKNVLSAELLSPVIVSEFVEPSKTQLMIVKQPRSIWANLGIGRKPQELWVGHPDAIVAIGTILFEDGWPDAEFIEEEAPDAKS